MSEGQSSERSAAGSSSDSAKNGDSGETPRIWRWQAWGHLAGWPLFAGGLTAVLGVAGMWAVGRVSSAEAATLLESMFPTTRFLCSSIMTASATILALMLTLLGITQNTDSKLKPAFYRRVRLIAFLDSLTFASATLLLMLHSIPIQESDNVPTSWYRIMYYVLMAASSAVSGLLAVIVMSLYDTIRDMIHVVGAYKESSLLVEEE